MNTAGNTAQIVPSLSANNDSLLTRVGRALVGAFVPASKPHAGQTAAAPLAETRLVGKRSTISSSSVSEGSEVQALVNVAASPRRPGLPARWKCTNRVVINYLD